jgi:hypothetical protein
MGSFHFLFLIPIFISLFVHCSPSPIVQAAIDKRTHAYYNCTRNSTSAPYDAYRSNIKTLLDLLSSNSSNNARYYNATVVSGKTVDTVYGLFICRHFDPKICQSCVIEAAKLLLSLCTTAKEAIVWYLVCYVRYSDDNFFSTVEKTPELSFINDKDYVGPVVGRFNNILWDMLNDLRIEAANVSAKFAGKSANLTENQKLYGHVWCLPCLSAENCRWCLSDAIAEVSTSCCRGKSGGAIFYPSCGLRYELYPFDKTNDNISWVPSPPTSPRPLAPPGLNF